MLNIYYGRENLNKSKFIFDNIVENAVLMVYMLELLEQSNKWKNMKIP